VTECDGVSVEQMQTAQSSIKAITYPDAKPGTLRPHANLRVPGESGFDEKYV